jgi:F-type H+-transporting ATPase subunit epsilon
VQLEVLLPFGIFATKTGVSRIIAETRAGSFGILPRRLDCVAALEPGILTYQCAGQAETYLAVDAGVLVKTGEKVSVCVRNAIVGTSLSELRAAVAREYLHLDAEEQNVRGSLAKIESDFLRRLARLSHE